MKRNPTHMRTRACSFNGVDGLAKFDFFIKYILFLFFKKKYILVWLFFYAQLKFPQSLNDFLTQAQGGYYEKNLYNIFESK